jgi:excisionase family DNA binding protein
MTVTIDSREREMQVTLVKPRLLTTDEAAEFLGVSAGTLAVWRCVSRYPLPYIKIGHNVRYDEADLAAWIESRKVRQEVPA